MKISDQTRNLDSTSESASIAYYPDGRIEAMETEIVKEHFMTVSVNGSLVFRTVCTPSYLAEMVVGRLLTEQLIRDVHEIRRIYICESGSRAKVFLDHTVSFEKSVQADPTCCTDNRTFLKNPSNQELQPLKNAKWKPAWIFRMTQAFSDDSSIHRITRGTHGCYLSVDGEIVFSCEDIGRHNTLDKAIGYAALHGYPPERCMLFTTGRVATDMVRKVVAAGIPVFVSKAVPTDEAVEMARYYNLNLICKAWNDRFEVFSRNPVILREARVRPSQLPAI